MNNPDSMNKTPRATRYDIMPNPEVYQKVLGKPVKSFPPTELGSAKRMEYYFGEYIRYVSPAKRWYIWYGDRWRPEQAGETMRLAKILPHLITLEANAERNLDRQKKLYKHAESCQSLRVLSNVIKLLQTEAAVVARPEDFDTQKDLVNLLNGTINLSTGILEPHQPSNFLSRQMPVVFDPQAQCPTWDSFLMHAMDGNAEMIEYLQEVFGYCLTESTAERCLFYLYGEGRTGKSTLLNVWRNIMGDYSQNMAPHSLVAQKYPGAINNDIARMQNVRMVTAIETDSDQSFSEALVKQLTGGTDTVSARFLYAEYFDFVPIAKIFVASNHLMGIKGSDEAIWDRIRLIPFNVRVAEDKQDKGLFEKLLMEKAGIFN